MFCSVSGIHFIYGKFIERIVGVDETRETPAYKLNDGVDYTQMSKYKLYLIYFLNIAGLGPIFGAIQGALFGPAAFLWIVLGTIFVGSCALCFNSLSDSKEEALYHHTSACDIMYFDYILIYSPGS